MKKENKEVFNIGLVGIMIGAIFFVIAILIQNTVLKWIILIIGSIFGALGLLLFFTSIIGDYSEAKKEGFLSDLSKTSFTKKLQDINYRKEFMTKITNALENGQVLRLSLIDINNIVIDLKKAQSNLTGEEFQKITDLYLINTLKKPNNVLNEIEQYHFENEIKYKLAIDSKEQYFNTIKSVLVNYCEIAPLDAFTFLDGEEYQIINNLISKEYAEHMQLVNRIFAEISSTANYNTSLISDKLKKLSSDQIMRIEYCLDEIEDMHNSNELAKKFFVEHSLDSFYEKARNGIMTNEEFIEYGLAYLLYKRKLDDTKPEKIQIKINWIVEMLNYDSNEPYISGTPLIDDNSIGSKEEWHQYVNQTLDEIQQSECDFESKITLLYNLTEHIFNVFQIYPICEIEQRDNNKIKETIKSVFEIRYSVIREDKIFDFSEDDDYGIISDKPIYTKGANSTNSYLKHLTTTLGEELSWERQGSMNVDGINGMIDIYEGYLPSGKRYKTLYVNMYGTANSTTAPKGFKFK